jgi:hypothetical protein
MEENQYLDILTPTTNYIKTQTMDITELVNWTPAEITSKLSNLSFSDLESLKNSQSDVLLCDLKHNNEFKHFKLDSGEEHLVKKFGLDIIWTEALIYNILNQKLHLDYNVGFFYNFDFLFLVCLRYHIFF